MIATIIPDMRDHYPVLLTEIISIITPQYGGTFIDCTFGQGGYTKKILEFSGTKVIGLDRDSESLKNAKEIQNKLKRCIVHKDHMEATHESYAIAILTEWDEFISYPWDLIISRMMRPSKIYDGRNIIKKDNHLANIVEGIGN